MQRLSGNHHTVQGINIINSFLLKDESKRRSRNSHNKKPLEKHRANWEMCHPVIFPHREEGYATWQCGLQGLLASGESNIVFQKERGEESWWPYDRLASMGGNLGKHPCPKTISFLIGMSRFDRLKRIIASEVQNSTKLLFVTFLHHKKL